MTAFPVTVMTHWAVMPFDAVAVMVAVPIFRGVTAPLTTFATVSSEEDQVTLLSVAFSGRTVAMRFRLLPKGREASVLFKVILVVGTTTLFTVMVQVAVLPLAVAAVMVVVPSLTAVIKPL